MRQIRVNAVAREQLDKFDDYVRTMRSKVEKQREDRKKYNETLQERLKEQEEVVRFYSYEKLIHVYDQGF